MRWESHDEGLEMITGLLTGEAGTDSDRAERSTGLTTLAIACLLTVIVALIMVDLHLREGKRSRFDPCPTKTIA